MIPDYKENYTVKTTKGYYGNASLTAWVSIPNCFPDTCRIVNLCVYRKTTNPEKPIRCGTVRSYMSSVGAMVHRCFQDQLQSDEYMLFKVGMHLMPLYLTLCKLKIEELAVEHAVEVTHRGDRKADPVYKEIRETIKMINLAWKDVGLRKPSDPIEPKKVPKGVAEGYEDLLFEEEPQEDDKPVLEID